MAYGLTEAGFNRKTQSIIQDELIVDFQSLPGYGDIKTEPGSGFGQIIGVLGDQLAALWELAEEVTLSAYRTTATGSALNQALATIGQSRLGAAKATAAVTFKSIDTSPVPIPEGTLISQSATNLTQWENIQKGQDPTIDIDFAGYRYIISPRDLASFVHNDPPQLPYIFALLTLS